MYKTSLGVRYSIVRHLIDAIDVDADIMRTMAKPPETFPFVFVEKRPSIYGKMTKLNETVEVIDTTTLRIHANSLAEVEDVTTRIERSLLFDDIEYYKEDGTLTNDTLDIIDDNFLVTPVYTNVIENVSSYFLVHIDFSVRYTIHKNYIK